MEKYIPKDKLSKKARKEQNKKYRSVWKINPVTRRTEDPKVYRRHKEKEKTARQLNAYI